MGLGKIISAGLANMRGPDIPLPMDEVLRREVVLANYRRQQEHADQYGELMGRSAAMRQSRREREAKEEEQRRLAVEGTPSLGVSGIALTDESKAKAQAQADAERSELPRRSGAMGLRKVRMKRR